MSEVVALADTLLQVLAKRPSLLARSARTVVAIAGESGSGKSFTALCLAQALTRARVPAIVLHQDDYFVRPPASNHANRVADIGSVGPEEVDLARLAAHVEAFRRGDRVVDAPRVDYPGDRFVASPLDFSAAAVLVVEGTYVLAYLQSDIRVFLNATYEETRERRRERNRDIDSPFVERVLSIEHAIVAAQSTLADIVIDRNYTIIGGAP